MPLDANTLTMIGMGTTVVVTVVTCTWKLSRNIALGIKTTEDNTKALGDLASTFHNHVLESNGRDKDNQKEHAAINRTLEAQQVALTQIGRRIDTVEPKIEKHHVRIAVVETRLDIRKPATG